MTVSPATVWYVPVASIKEWVGPFSVTAFGQPVDTFRVAFLSNGQQLVDTDWEDPVPHPDGKVDGLGILVAEQTTHQLTLGQRYIIPVQLVLGQSKPVKPRVGIVVGV
jgi:hypothetical protein